jgi:hypothetical protein
MLFFTYIWSNTPSPQQQETIVSYITRKAAIFPAAGIAAFLLLKAGYKIFAAD